MAAKYTQDNQPTPAHASAQARTTHAQGMTITGRDDAIVTTIDDSLDAAQIHAALSATTQAQIAALEVLTEIDSTNSELLRRRNTREGASMPPADMQLADILFAEHQTGGRGRQGRVWVSPPACNLYVSIARAFAIDLARLGGLSLVVGVAVADALHSLGLDEIGLKWPNDLVVGDGAELHKLGGILIESGGARAGVVRAVIGLGLNVRMADAFAADHEAGGTHQNRIDQAWADVRQCLGEHTPSRNMIAAAVIETLLPALDRFERDGLAPTLARYSRFDALQGRTLETRGSSPTLIGIGDGIADDGALRLRTATGEVLLRAGEISVRTHSAAG
jgi:BirA family transcriptional regulator, biotin operon repressor / biotin---[acetyl-CoA-carboxylase] ligase